MARTRQRSSRASSSSTPERSPRIRRSQSATKPARKQSSSTPPRGQKARANAVREGSSSPDELAIDTSVTPRGIIPGRVNSSATQGTSKDDEPPRKRTRVSKGDDELTEMCRPSRPTPPNGNQPSTDQAPDRDVIEDAYQSLLPSELENAESWVDFESDEKMFNGILEKLGVIGLEAISILSIAQPEDVQPELSEAVFHGVIACIPAFEGEGDPTNVENPAEHELWFAKQHWGLACGTIALLHVLLNQEEAYVGDMLLDFQNETSNRNKYEKGFMIDNHRGIRAAHNMFSTRYEHLQVNKTLAADVEANDKAKAPRKERGPLKPMPAIKHAIPSCLHFVAYVPHRGNVWALDGLKENPRVIEAIPESGEWWREALKDIRYYWKQHEHHVSVLGVTSNNLLPIQQSLAQTAFFCTLFKHTFAYENLREVHSDLKAMPLDVDDQKSLDHVGLSLRFVHSQGHRLPEAELRKARGEFQDDEDPYQWFSALCMKGANQISEYGRKYAAKTNERNFQAAQREQWGLVVHRWVKKLVEKRPESFKDLIMQHQVGRRK